jgi:subtilase family serine protease
MDFAYGRSINVSSVLLLMLLSLQAMSGISLASATSAKGSAEPEVSTTTAAGFSPTYLVLGGLEGSSVVQSNLPRSLPIDQLSMFEANYYTGSNLAQAYGASNMTAKGDGGKGQTIAIIDAFGDPTIYQDVATFDNITGLPPANMTIIPVGPYEPANGITQGWAVETALDVEAAHSMAPYAHINLVIGANNSNALYYAVKDVVDNHLGDVVTMSWGLGENLYGQSGFSDFGFLNYPYVDYYFQKGTQEGITFFASTGDYGAYGGSYAATADFPASSPFVTAVGGTTLYLSSKSGYFSSYNASALYEDESAWSIDPGYIGSPGASSGGGVSNFFAQPFYQAGAYSSTHRTVPDVAADANPYTGMVMIVQGQRVVTGGTSLATPLWAGMTADINQYIGSDVGLLNPYLYSIYAHKAAYANDFHQVASGFNGAYSAGSGYNLVTGLGSPDLSALASDVKAMKTGMSISVDTSQGAGGQYAPAQYSQKDSFTLSAAATVSGTSVTSGTFSAKIVGLGGEVATVPLAYDGNNWTGSYTIPAGAPSGSWTITVTGDSGSSTGTGMADLNVGVSFGILSPIPYPYGPPIPPNQPFEIVAFAQAYSGPPTAGLVLNAFLISGGKLVQTVPLNDAGGGYYVAQTEMKAGEPQGDYTLVVNGTGEGSVYEYLYVGQGIVGVIIGPNNDAIPSAAPGQQVVLLAEPRTYNGAGMFTSNVTANFYSLSGALVASTALEPSPDTTQFGAFNFFPYRQANFTIPTSFSPGFYKVQFISSYAGNSTTGTQMGNYTTGLYISGAQGSYTASHQSAVYEGQYVRIAAQITDSAGNPVTSGVFYATVIPSGYAFEAAATNLLGYTGIPLQYDPALGAWQAVYQIPSVLTSPNAFIGNTVGLASGPYTVFISGESSSSVNIVPEYSYVNVLPYTWIGSAKITPSNAASMSLLTSNTTSYTLSNVAADALSVSGVNITFSDDQVQSLSIKGGTVILSDDTVGSVSASSSSLSLVKGTSVGNLSLSSTHLAVSGSTYTSISPALPTISVSGLSNPISNETSITITVTGEQLASGSLMSTVDGNPIMLTFTNSSSGITAVANIDAISLSDGIHTLSVTVSQTDGMSASLNTQFATDAHSAALSSQVTSLSSQVSTLSGQSTSLSSQVTSLSNTVTSLSNQKNTLTYITYAAVALALVGTLLALWALRRKPRHP